MKLPSNVRTHAKRYLQFGGVGATGTVVDIAIVTAVLVAGGHWLLGQALAWICAVTWNWYWNWRWTFGRPPGSRVWSWAGFVGASSLGGACRLAVVTLLLTQTGLPVLVATGVGIAVAGTVNYLGALRVLDPNRAVVP